jgi:SAM-dependent methyltransferase
MLAACEEADPTIPTHRVDAADLPFEDRSFGCVVAMLCLHDMNDLEGVAKEVARVLTPGGRFCIALWHPLASAGYFTERTHDSPFLLAGSYLQESHYVDDRARAGLEISIVSIHRPIQAYTNALTNAGLLIEKLVEQPVPDHAITHKGKERWQRVPPFMHIRAVKN